MKIQVIKKEQSELKLVPHSEHLGMFYIQWPDGSISEDFYNKSRANNYRLKFAEKERKDRVLDRCPEPLGSPLVRLNTHMAT